MKNIKTQNITIGSVAAILCASIIIYSIEHEKSFLQICLGFLIYIFPFTFSSLFTSKVGAFIFVFFTTLIIYLISSFFLLEFWFGVILAGIIGGAAFYYRVNRTRIFSSSEYKQKAKN